MGAADWEWAQFKGGVNLFSTSKRTGMGTIQGQEVFKEIRHTLKGLTTWNLPLLASEYKITFVKVSS